MWIRRSRNLPLGGQLYEGLRQAILRGELLPGERLPSTRVLAAREGIGRNTALRVYRRLVEEGYVEGCHGRGTFVATDLAGCQGVPSRRPASRRAKRRRKLATSRRSERLAKLAPSWVAPSRSLPYDFHYGRPSDEDFPWTTWRRVLFRCVRELSLRELEYGDPAGLPALRSQIAMHLRETRGVACDDEQILIVNGSQQGLCLAAEVLLDPGDRVVMEEPGYAGAQTVFRAAGATLMAAPVGPDGVDFGELAGSTRSTRIVYVTPSHQFPTGTVMSLPQRFALLEWARRRGAWIFEDDYDSELRYGVRPVESLQGLDPNDSVLYAGTFSKLMFPAMRIGYLVAPRPIVAKLRTAKAVADTGTSMLQHHALAEFMAAGHFGRHIRRSRARNARRRAALVTELVDRLGLEVEVLGADAGLHVMLRFPRIPLRAEARIIARAAEVGVGVYSPSSFFLRPRRGGPASLLLGYASLSPEAIRRGAARLASIVSGVSRSASRLRSTSAGRSSITK